MKASFEQSTYMKIYHMIANDITIGVYKAGDIIPTQMELAKKYAVSRATISEAIKELTRRKLVKTQRGKGTFVIVHPLEIGNFKRFDGFSSFRSKHRDRDLTSKVIDVSLIDIPEKIARCLHAPATAKVWRVCRVRYVDGTPMSHETSFCCRIISTASTSETRIWSAVRCTPYFARRRGWSSAIPWIA